MSERVCNLHPYMGGVTSKSDFDAEASRAKTVEQENKDAIDTLNNDVFHLSTSNLIHLNSGADLNDYKSPGNYVCTSNTVANTIQNKPSGFGASAFRMTVINIISSDYSTQILHSYLSNDIGMRTYIKNMDEWMSWKTL